MRLRDHSAFRNVAHWWTVSTPVLFPITFVPGASTPRGLEETVIASTHKKKSYKAFCCLLDPHLNSEGESEEVSKWISVLLHPLSCIFFSFFFCLSYSCSPKSRSWRVGRFSSPSRKTTQTNGGRALKLSRPIASWNRGDSVTGLASPNSGQTQTTEQE